MTAAARMGSGIRPALIVALAVLAVGVARCGDLVEIRNANLNLVTSEKDAKSTRTPITSALLATPAHLHDDNEIAVEFSMSVDKPSDFKPQQRVLTLTHSERRTQAARFVGDVTSSGKGSLKVTFQVTADAVEKQLGTLNGEYEAEVVVADASFKNSYKFGFGKVLVSHAHQADGSLSSDPELYPRETKYAPKEEFEHIMREADKRPPSMISLVFAGAMFCPLVLLMLVVQQSGANLKKLPSVFFQAVLFHSGIAATLGLIVYYWLSLPFLQTVPILLGLSAFAGLTGFHLLRGLCKVSEKAE
ncbi:subunit 2 of dolichyl-diphosphooligosaccharide--protein glycosyltransferase [Chloropicon primus]|uniref:Ribophorin II n=1 Tax=Chloropicon primus TaxID=1764295 RepID=A0A5B8MI52_9CHLO|nr:subunit 2 of dolichyl-diphosphooligosaccharide--protein glycosyltransferase [Chloropicon primus]UPQ98259.1 subunit 2 of dolichyl-diphosphooligosaccharide--protein glycosyltransferase [Chloropicon primus]|eukprot:QDZ19050.1 subunit 2 of dolichyl-diphosphooligosaccharide--protein glycosyltransferase [Chloropicon primus]